ncbi:protein lifeguard 3-like isoform X1 [Hypomesus transpacificus]|uniref:protein lifeguard 3-like isoform X1 n=1 Tax=Hypomesus transpacificus TaxID=137520 RepID=UPI001F079D28|nr:protein lifeguard 3-like isoform X1 [Hypomesus transpacificus]XP_046902712.1 protein lifeguard 3-like isoform X1 [Hypomesus transpacificus]XP_046902713.1 protein lifeguard 3-like isoform X1 [Hypomesus transpacificus]
MAKANLPPTYEDSLRGPRYDNYPQQSGYGLPGYGGPLPQPPAYISAPGLSTPQYPGHAGLYPGTRMTPCYTASGLPSIIPTAPLGMPTSTGDMDEFAYDRTWESTAIRHGFIRKVYMLLAAQLAVTVSIVAVFTFVEPVRMFVIRNPSIYWASLGVYFVTYLILVCCKGPRRRFPWNLLLLFVFTLAMSYMTGSIASYYETKAVFLALGITAIVCFAVTTFCFQTKVDFTSCGGLFCILAIVVMVTGIITAIMLSFQYVPWLHMLYAAIGAIVYTLFLAYNTQLLIGNRELALSPEEYVFGALSLYVDIVQIFLFLLQIGGAATD